MADAPYPEYRITSGEGFRLADHDPDETEGHEEKQDVKDELSGHRERIGDLQERLYAEQGQSVLVCLQATDTGGKDGTIKHVFKGVNPQGCRVYSYKQPNDTEKARDFLWRYHQHTPPKGLIHIFNRSHYEEVLVVRVKDLVPEEVWRPRYEFIREWERALASQRIVVLKFYLHISKDEQKSRLERRLKRGDKRWKFSTADLEERKRWDQYQRAFEDAIAETATDYAPWYVVPANNKWYRNLVIARTIADTLEAMDPQFPDEEEGLDDIVIPD